VNERVIVNRSLRTCAILVTAVATIAFAGCQLPGKPAPGPEVPVPSAELDFTKLYKQNCSGCHGDNGQHGAAIAMNNPTYLALVDDATLKNVTTNGYKNGLMPGFGSKAGGMLTEAQIDVIVKGMRDHWGKGNVLAGLNAPPYASTKAGDVKHGEEVYNTACARCHGAPGTGAQKGSILNGSYLGLMNEQSLRTITIVGRPELGMPDWRGDAAGHPLSDEDVTNVVAWLQAQTPGYPGQPYATSSSMGAGSDAPPMNPKGGK
jgi:cytochrome c oxidase cbb3-type subunit 3/ubiquinol-cytochrome c reductase cytochrome c subunit